MRRDVDAYMTTDTEVGDDDDGDNDSSSDDDDEEDDDDDDGDESDGQFEAKTTTQKK